MQITVTSLSKQFGSFKALDNIDLSIASGELLALLGPSGSGKTTLLRTIAGLEQATQGGIRFGTEEVGGTDVGARGVGFVFQHYALFRHMTVAENVAFGLTVKPRAERPDRREIAARVAELLRLVQLQELANRLPHQLSGGQRQRVALARALAVRPKVLLLDEPFGALDAKVRLELRRWLRRLHDETGLTSVFVTHDQEEALEVADRVAILNHGRLEQVGTPDEVSRQPASAFVHHFLGLVNVFHGRAGPAAAGSAHLTLVRPHDVDLSRVAEAPCTQPAQVLSIHAAGPLVRVALTTADSPQPVEAHLTHQRAEALALAVGDQVFVGYSRSRSYDQAGQATLSYDI